MNLPTKILGTLVFGILPAGVFVLAMFIIDQDTSYSEDMKWYDYIVLGIIFCLPGAVTIIVFFFMERHENKLELQNKFLRNLC